MLVGNYLWHCSWSSATLDRWLSFCFWITHLVNDFQMRRVNAAKRELKEWLRNQSFTHGAYFLSFIYMNWFPRDQSVTFSMFPPVLWINFSYQYFWQQRDSNPQPLSLQTNTQPNDWPNDWAVAQSQHSSIIWPQLCHN